ncbi:hypothetical protein AOLI_G00313090, partial [Acnodon oligacanthus]
MLDESHQSSMHYETYGDVTAVQVSVQCVDDPEGQHGCVVMDNISYGLPWLNTDTDDEGISPDFLEEEDLMVDDSHQSFTHCERHGDSTAVQHHNDHNSMNRPETGDAVDPSSTDTDHPRVSVQCEDDPEGQHGRVIFDNISDGLLQLNGDTDDAGI